MAHTLAKEVAGGSPRGLTVESQGSVLKSYDAYSQKDIFKASVMVDVLPIYADQSASSFLSMDNASGVHSGELPESIVTESKHETIQKCIQALSR